MITSEKIDLLADAMAKVQKTVKGATKDAENPYFKSRYADLASVWEACRESLTGNGCAVIQSPETEITGTPELPVVMVSVVTRLCHASGQWIEGKVTASLPDGKPQAVGSAITYLRRYALAAMVGVAPEDDDAEATTGRPPAPKKETDPNACPKCGAKVMWEDNTAEGGEKIPVDSDSGEIHSCRPSDLPEFDAEGKPIKWIDCPKECGVKVYWGKSVKGANITKGADGKAHFLTCTKVSRN